LTIAAGARWKTAPRWRILLTSLNLALSAFDKNLRVEGACFSLSYRISTATGRRSKPA